MILPQLLTRFARHRDDAVFYRLQADDAIRWLETRGVRFGPGTRVLDLGCGHGVFGGLLPEFHAAPFLRINLDREPLAPLGRYDVVICSNVLEHLARPAEFLAQGHDLLAPGGTFYLSWTNWLSPWGGHEFSPLHYLGPRLGPRLWDALGRPRFHRPGTNLFVTHIGRTLRDLRTRTRLEVAAAAPRYYTEFAFLLRVPLVREFLAWNCALALRRRA
jgi:SAM-dependent methyltransferase